MKPEEFFKMRAEQKEKEKKYTPKELAELNEARKRHSLKVRDEILTSYILDKKREGSGEDIIHSFPVDISKKIDEEFIDPDKENVKNILEDLYKEFIGLATIAKAIRSILFIAKGEISVVEKYCLPYLQYDPRDIVIEAEQLAGNPGHGFGIPFDQMESLSENFSDKKEKDNPINPQP